MVIKNKKAQVEYTTDLFIGIGVILICIFIFAIMIYIQNEKKETNQKNTKDTLELQMFITALLEYPIQDQYEMVPLRKYVYAIHDKDKQLILKNQLLQLCRHTKNYRIIIEKDGKEIVEASGQVSGEYTEMTQKMPVVGFDVIQIRVQKYE